MRQRGIEFRRGAHKGLVSRKNAVEHLAPIKAHKKLLRPASSSSLWGEQKKKKEEQKKEEEPVSE